MRHQLRVGVVLLCCCAVRGYAQQATIARGWRVASAAPIKIHAPSGLVEVEGWSRDSVALSASLAAGESLFGGGSVTGLKVGAEGTATAGRSRMHVRVPVGARVVVRSGAAHVVVRGVSGVIDVGSAAGDVHVSGDAESVTVESIGGNVRIAASARSLRARTTRGAIDVVGHADEAQLSSVSGKVTVSVPRLGRLRIETVDGGVHVRGALETSGSLEVETFGGSALLEFPAHQRAALDLRASRGAISGTVGSGASGVAPVDLASAVVRSGATASVTQRIGGGSGPVPPVTVRTFRGRITVQAAGRG